MSISGKSIRRDIKKYMSPTFLIMLLIAFALWYIKKLGYTYRSEVPLTVVAMGQKVKVGCTAEGTGYRLLAYKSLMSTRIEMAADELRELPPSAAGKVYRIDALALQNAVSVKLKELKILSVGAAPEIIVPDKTASE